MRHPDRKTNSALPSVHQRMAEQRRNVAQVQANALLEVLTESAREALGRAGAGWYLDSDVSVQPTNGPPVRLDLVGFKRIDVGVNAGSLQARCTELTKRASSPQSIQIAKDVVGAMVALWAGHYDHCPYDQWRHDRLCEAAAEGAFDTLEISSGQWKLAGTVACFFERSIVAGILSKRHGAEFARGVTLEQVVNERPVSLLTDLFFQSQSMLTPRAWRPVLEQWPVGDASACLRCTRSKAPRQVRASGHPP